MDTLTERFQITVPAKEEAGEPFVMPESARRSRSSQFAGEMPVGDMLPGANFPQALAGENDPTDPGRAALPEGKVKLPMGGADDMYTGEHVDHFYGDAGGFAERNNYLDRL